jgi:hypothetical protein
MFRVLVELPLLPKVVTFMLYELALKVPWLSEKLPAVKFPTKLKVDPEPETVRLSKEPPFVVSVLVADVAPIVNPALV